MVHVPEVADLMRRDVIQGLLRGKSQKAVHAYVSLCGAALAAVVTPAVILWRHKA